VPGCCGAALIDQPGLCAQIARQRQQSTRGGSAMPCDGSCLHNSCTGLRHPAALASAASRQRGDTNMRARLSRRVVVGMLAAAGASAALGARRSSAQGAAGKDWIIDTHHHIYPPRYISANLQRLLEDTSVLGASAYTGWSPQLALEQMD